MAEDLGTTTAGMGVVSSSLFWCYSFGQLTWIPTYFKESMGLSIKDDILKAILLPVGQACAMYLFLVLTDKLFKGRREPMLVLCSLISVVGLVIYSSL